MLIESHMPKEVSNLVDRLQRREFFDDLDLHLIDLQSVLRDTVP